MASVVMRVREREGGWDRYYVDDTSGTLGVVIPQAQHANGKVRTS